MVNKKGVQSSLLKGGAYILLAATAYACMSVCVKLGKGLSNKELVFARNAVCLLLLIPWILYPHPKSLVTKHFPTHCIRALAGLLNMYCFFYSIRYILLTDALVLNNTMPLFVPLVMWIWKREKLNLPLLPGMLLGFLGVILILRPGASALQPAALMALASGIFMSISMAGIRELGKEEPLYRILFYYFAISTAISVIPLLDSFRLLPWHLVFILGGVGLFALLYQYFLTCGYHFASAQVISPLIYFSVILTGVFDWLIWDKIPDIFSYLGIVSVILGAIWCILAEGHKQK